MPVPILNELLIGTVAKVLLEHLAKQGVQLALPQERIRAWLGRDRAQLALQLALARAFATFADRHPNWAASLFDQSFLVGPAAPLLARCLTPAGSPDPSELAHVWAAQLGPENTTRAGRLSEATAVSGDFLRMFEAELRQRDEFRPLYDSRALDAIEHSAAQTAESLQALRAELSQALDQANRTYQVSLAHGLGVLIGDNAQQTNVFNLYSQAARSLADQIRTHEFDTLVRERTRGFVGRDFIFRAIDDLLLNPEFPSGYIVVRGEPGIGKTALLAELVKRRGYVHHFNVAPQNIRSVRDFLANTCAQLIVRYGLEHTELPAEATRDSGFLGRLLAEAAAKESGSPVVVLVDALDEAEDAGLAAAANRLLLPQVLPTPVYFIVSTREKEEYRLVVDRREDIYLDDKSTQNLEDVRQHIENFIGAHQAAMDTRIAEWGVSQDDFVSAMIDRSQGNFMYLVYVLNDIRSGNLTVKNIDNIRKLPQGLKSYYQRHWLAMEVQDPNLFDRLYKPVVLILAAAREPVTVGQLAEWTRLEPFNVRRVMVDWREFLNADEDETGEPRYRIYHASFQDFLREDVGLKQQHAIIAETALSKIPGFLQLQLPLKLQPDRP
jgi:hypothetical protein